MHTEEASPLVSVVIPTFNRAWVLETAVTSVLMQDYERIETVVVDDGSTDGTDHILGPFLDRITLVRQENKGVSAARNTGIRLSRGDFVAFLDSDDQWLPAKLRSQVDFFRKHPEADICQTEEIWIRNGRRVNPMNKHQKRSGMIFEPSLHLCLVSPSAVMMRRRLLDRVGLFDETLPACEDYDLWLRVSVTTPIHLINEMLTVKTGGHEDQLSRQHSLDRFRIQSIKKLLDSDRLSPDQRQEAIRVFDDKCRVYGNGCLKRGKTEEGLRFLDMVGRYTE